MLRRVNSGETRVGLKGQPGQLTSVVGSVIFLFSYLNWCILRHIVSYYCLIISMINLLA